MEKEIDLPSLFKIRDQVVVFVGGTGVLGQELVRDLAGLGAKVAIISRQQRKAEALASEIRASGGEALGLSCDAMERAAIEWVRVEVESRLGPVDTLINAAGGNQPDATTAPGLSFFELSLPAMERVFSMNLLGTVQCCQVFGAGMAERGQGCIVNIASMSGIRPLTRIPAYNAAKAAVANFTQWLAVHMAQEYSPLIRVNALAPGFFLTEQNRYLLIDSKTGGLTERGQAILEHTPASRFGTPEDLLGTLLWLISPASSFVTGIVVPVDGGFSAYSGV